MSGLSLPAMPVARAGAGKQDAATPPCCLRVGRAETEVGVCHPTIRFPCGPRGLVGLKSIPKKWLTPLPLEIFD